MICLQVSSMMLVFMTVIKHDLHTGKFNDASFYDYAMRNDLHTHEFNKASVYDYVMRNRLHTGRINYARFHDYNQERFAYR